MPRKTKETEKIEEKNKKTKKTTSTANKDLKVSKVKPTKTTKAKSNADSKIAKAKRGITTKAAETKKRSTVKVAETNKKSTTKAKVTTKVVKSTAKNTKNAKNTKSATNTKKATKAVKSTAKKTATKTKATVNKPVLKTYSPEYYDLPFKYNKTVVTILAQTPTNLFIYWEISDEDRNNLKNQYGEYFFEITKPVLIIHNLTKNYSFEIDIDDFANSWYIHVNDSDCEYKIELGRRPIAINYSYMPQYDIQKQGPIEPITNPYIYISSSNELISPNDHVLFNWSDEIYFKNVKTKEVIVKHMKDLSFINKYGQIINLYELYKKEYGDDFLRNPTSGSSSSLSFSSNFK